jgi:hypothetical protein
MFFFNEPKRLLDQGSGGAFSMATKSSYFLAILLIANPFMLLVFQNCSSGTHDRTIASDDSSIERVQAQEPEYSVTIDKNLKIK